jgi:hypothetical protein
MELRRRRLRSEHANRLGQFAIERAHQVFRRDRRVEGKRGDLAPSMDSGIRTAAALGQYAFAGDPLEDIGQRALNRDPVRLHLPAKKIRAVIRQCQFPVQENSAFFCVPDWILPFNYFALNCRICTSGEIIETLRYTQLS